MATGASGSFKSEGWSGNTGDIVMTVTWTQEYTPGNTYSDVKISAQCKRNGTSTALGGTWFAYSDGGISVNGTQACGWYKNQSGSWTNNGDVGWSGSGSVRINHTAATNVTITIASVQWNNSSYSSSSFTIPSKSESVTLNAIPQPYTLSISAGSGSWITVTKNDSTLSNGASIYSGDVLTISGGANTGYNFGGLTVNGSAFTSGSTHTVSSAVTVTSTATAKSYSLSISAGTGSTITVNRTSSQYGGGATGVLSNGATIYYGDALKIDFGASTGFNLSTHTVNGAAFTSGTTYSVSSTVTVASTATAKSYSLSISAGTGSTITVNRTSSQYGDGATGVLSNGATIYYGDALKIDFGASTGFNLSTHTVNGAAFTSGNTYSVSSAVTVTSTATAKSYSLSISAGTGSTITVDRTSSQYGGGATGVLSNGATIYYGDALKIDFTILSGYEVKTTTVNGETFISGNIHTVTSNVTVVSTAVLGIPRYQMYIDDGTTWCPVLPYIDVGSAWSGSE